MSRTCIESQWTRPVSGAMQARLWNPLTVLFGRPAVLPRNLPLPRDCCFEGQCVDPTSSSPARCHFWKVPSWIDSRFDLPQVHDCQDCRNHTVTSHSHINADAVASDVRHSGVGFSRRVGKRLLQVAFFENASHERRVPWPR